MTSAFKLEVGGDGLATLTFDLPDRKVNIFTREAMEDLGRAIDELGKAGEDIGCLVLLSAKEKSFCVGADIEGIARVTDAEEAAGYVARGQELFAAWEALPFPTVAAIQGTCMGGGTELALASTYRVLGDRDDVRLGLPEVRLGILPAWGGCTRLPRLIGIADALDLILAGKTVNPRKALKLGLADALLPDAGFLAYVRDFARSKIGKKSRAHGDADLKELLLEKNPLGRKILFDQARKRTLDKTGGHYPAPLRAIEVVRLGIEKGREAGFEAEGRAAAELVTSPVCKNLVHIFQLSEGVKKVRGAEAEPRPVRTAAVVGAGVMGGGIGQLIAHKAAVPVRLKDIEMGALASGMGHAAKLFANRVQRRRLTAVEMRGKMNLLTPTLDYSGFRRADLVVEAVVEKLGVKQKVFADLAAVVPENAVLASNTSSLDIDAIGRDTPRPERVVGMHFFNPVHRMPLVEVVVGENTGAEAVATIFDFARRLGKTPIKVKSTPGFLVNRLLTFYMAEAMWLLDEGHRIADLDRAMDAWGMPLGPFALLDEVGIDVALHVTEILTEAFGDRLATPTWGERLAESGRLGAKGGSGFYRYDGRERKDPDPSIYRVLGLKPHLGDPDPARLADRMVLPMVNEAARCLEEGVVGSPGDLDLAMIMGTGFPPFRGGLCRWADNQSLDEIARSLETLAATAGERLAPCPALRAAAASGGFYAHGWPGFGN